MYVWNTKELSTKRRRKEEKKRRREGERKRRKKRECIEGRERRKGEE